MNRIRTLAPLVLAIVGASLLFVGAARADVRPWSADAHEATSWWYALPSLLVIGLAGVFGWLRRFGVVALLVLCSLAMSARADIAAPSGALATPAESGGIGATGPAASEPPPSPKQVIDAGETLYQDVEHGDYWPLLALIPFAVMFGLRWLHQKRLGSWTAVMAHPVAVVAAGALATACQTIGHAALSGHPVDKALLEHTAAAFGAVLFAWYQRQSAATVTPSQTVVAPVAAAA